MSFPAYLEQLKQAKEKFQDMPLVGSKTVFLQRLFGEECPIKHVISSQFSWDDLYHAFDEYVAAQKTKLEADESFVDESLDEFQIGFTLYVATKNKSLKVALQSAEEGTKAIFAEKEYKDAFNEHRLFIHAANKEYLTYLDAEIARLYGDSRYKKMSEMPRKIREFIKNQKDNELLSITYLKYDHAKEIDSALMKKETDNNLNAKEKLYHYSQQFDPFILTQNRDTRTMQFFKKIYYGLQRLRFFFETYCFSFMPRCERDGRKRGKGSSLYDQRDFVSKQDATICS